MEAAVLRARATTRPFGLEDMEIYWIENALLVVRLRFALPVRLSTLQLDHGGG